MYCNIRRNKIAHDDGNTPFVMDGSPTIPSVENKKVDDVLVFDRHSPSNKNQHWHRIPTPLLSYGKSTRNGINSICGRNRIQNFLTRSKHQSRHTGPLGSCYETIVGDILWYSYKDQREEQRRLFVSHVKKCRKDLSNGSNAIRQATPRMVFFTDAWQCCGWMQY